VDAENKIWQGTLTFAQTPHGNWQVTPIVVFNSDDPFQGAVVGANLQPGTPFSENWSAGNNMVWSFCIHYHPENWGNGGLLYDLEEC
jgi:hypothetical protein